MPVEVTRNRDSHFVEVKCYGKLTVADVSESLDTAFGTHLIEPGLDRVVFLDPRAQLHELDLEALQRIKRKAVPVADSQRAEPSPDSAAAGDTDATKDDDAAV